VLITLEKGTNDAWSLLGVSEPIPQGAKSAWFSVEAPSVDSATELMQSVLWSTEFVNDWRGISLIAIAKDRASFAYENEIGEIKAARIGDVITREYGSVKEINTEGVRVVELLENGVGGYEEVQRSILLKKECK
jgi:hypothetical protein